MIKKEQQMCPLYPDEPCPRGKESAQECEIRFNGNFDPVSDFRDLLIVHCALHRAHQQENNNHKKV